MIFKTLCLLFVGATTWAQVGIGTLNPQATLDVNGNLKIGTIETAVLNNLSKDSVMVTNGGFVKKASVKDLFNEEFKTSIKANFSSAGLINISLLTGSGIIPFDTELFDFDNSFDPISHEFTVNKDGVYHIIVQLKFSDLIGAATNLGVRIVKNGTVIYRTSYANVNVLSTNVTPPERKICTLQQLSKNDVIHFEIEGDIALGSIDLIGDSTTSFFAINRVK